MVNCIIIFRLIQPKQPYHFFYYQKSTITEHLYTTQKLSIMFQINPKTFYFTMFLHCNTFYVNCGIYFSFTLNNLENGVNTHSTTKRRYIYIYYASLKLFWKTLRRCWITDGICEFDGEQLRVQPCVAFQTMSSIVNVLSIWFCMKVSRSM